MIQDAQALRRANLGQPKFESGECNRIGRVYIGAGEQARRNSNLGKPKFK